MNGSRRREEQSGIDDWGGRGRGGRRGGERERRERERERERRERERRKRERERGGTEGEQSCVKVVKS